MTSLLFHDLPPGPVPLYIGEPAEKVVETGLLVLDHVKRTVRFVEADPFGPFEVPGHSAQRFARWEVDAMMPRWQLRELYGEAQPLLERIQMGTTMTQLPTHWDRRQTPEAKATVALLDELVARPAETAVDWAPSLRPVRPETALERAIRLEGGMSFEAARGAFLWHMQEKELSGSPMDIDERVIRNVIAHGVIHPASPAQAGSSGMSRYLDAIREVRIPLHHDIKPNLIVSKPVDERMARKVKSGLAAQANDRKYSRKGVSGQWGKLFETDETPRFFI